jgi:hypothetical protein
MCMLELGVTPEEIPGVITLDLPEGDIAEHPDDPTIPFLLLDESTELSLISRGRFREAYLMRQHKKRLYGVWIAALSRLKLRIQEARLRSRRSPFGGVLKFDYKVSRGLLFLRLAGFLHFSGISKRFDRRAVELVRHMSNVLGERAA